MRPDLLSPVSFLRVRRNLAIADLGDLVELPLVAVLATRRADKSVLLSPVWHEYRDGGFNVCTSHNDVKVRHLRRDPTAALVLAESLPPYRGVELTTDPSFNGDDVIGTVTRIAVRYLGSDAGLAYAASAPDDIVIRLEPGRVRAWDFADAAAQG